MSNKHEAFDWDDDTWVHGYVVDIKNAEEIVKSNGIKEVTPHEYMVEHNKRIEDMTINDADWWTDNSMCSDNECEECGSSYEKEWRPLDGFTGLICPNCGETMDACDLCIYRHSEKCDCGFDGLCVMDRLAQEWREKLNHTATK